MQAYLWLACEEKYAARTILGETARPLSSSCENNFLIHFYWRRSRAKQMKHHPLSRREQTSQVSKANDFTSDRRERLHPPSPRLRRDKQARRLREGEDVKKSLRLLSEERLPPREEKPCGFVRHFLSIKNGGESGIRTHGELPHTTFPMWRLRPLDHLSVRCFV